MRFLLDVANHIFAATPLGAEYSGMIWGGRYISADSRLDEPKVPSRLRGQSPSMVQTKINFQLLPHAVYIRMVCFEVRLTIANTIATDEMNYANNRQDVPFELGDVGL